MAMFELRITPDDGDTLDVSAGMRDVRMWEKTHKNRGLGQLSDGAAISATVLYELAFTAAKRSGLLPAGLTEDAFADQYELEVEEPAERAARIKAEALVARIAAGEVPSDDEPEGSEPEGDGADPTRPAV